jgi:aminoglycoside phosphotransferase (APT) family kinase protein
MALPPAVLAWAAAAVAADARVTRAVDLPQSHGNGPWRLDVETGGSQTQLVLHLGTADDKTESQRFTTQAAALRTAAGHGVAAPRLVAAELDAESTGHLAMLQTVLPGSSRIPQHASPSRLRAIGRAAAQIHAIPLEPTPALPARDRSIGDVDFAALTVPGPSAALFAAAREYLARARPPAAAASVFVHGDLWQGNMLFDGDRQTGTVDWDYAGAGPAGIDIGSLRCDIAVMYGLPAADEVLAGWQEQHGTPAADTSWWDLIAVTCSPPDLRLWLPNFHDQGRPDLDLATVTSRRDAFLAAALRDLGAGGHPS